jgi:integrase
MASIITRNGKRTLQWRMPSGKRYWAGLGSMGERSALSICQRLTEIIDELKHTTRLNPTSTAWLKSLNSTLTRRFVDCGILGQELSVAQLCAAFEARTERKEQTNVNYGHALGNLIDCYGGNTPASTVDGSLFRAYLKADKLAPSTVNKRISIARSVFKTITPNPFAEVVAGRQDNSARQCYVAADTILAVCRYADPELKLVLMLARFAGLRVPSELRAMRFSDIEWEHDKIYIRSPKTEHHKGGEGRYIPLFHQVRGPLLDAVERESGVSGGLAFGGLSPVTNVVLRRRVAMLLQRLGIKPWPRLFQNLRASWETDCLKLWPAETPKWAGHSHLISQRHYHMQTDDLFREAAKMIAPPPAQFAANRSSGQGVGESTTGSVSAGEQEAYRGAMAILPGLKPACNSRPNRARAAVGATTKRRQGLLLRSLRRQKKGEGER